MGEPTDPLRVPARRTPITMPEYARAVLCAWRVLGGELPSVRAVGVLWAQYMVETGGRACWGWNVGNVKAPPGSGHRYHCLDNVWEGVSLEAARKLLASG